MPTDEVNRRLQTRSIGGSRPAKYRSFSPLHMWVRSCEVTGGDWRGDMWRGSPQFFVDRRGQQRHHDFVMADQGVAFPAFLCRSTYHVGERTVVSQEVHVHGGKVGEIMTEIACQ